MKKRKKKYNPKKRAINDMKLKTANIAVLFYTGMDSPEPVTIDLLTMGPVAFPQIYRNYLMAYAWDWTLHLSVLCRSRLDNGYVKTWISGFKARYGDAVDSITNKHSELLKTVSKDHILTAAWIALPSTYELTEEQEEYIYSKYGAFDFMPPWEVRDNEEETLV